MCDFDSLGLPGAARSVEQGQQTGFDSAVDADFRVGQVGVRLVFRGVAEVVVLYAKGEKVMAGLEASDLILGSSDPRILEDRR